METTRILFLASNPQSTQALQLDKEWRTIFERIRSGPYRENLHLTMRLAVRPADLTDALLESQPHIVHFSGHGDSNGNIILESDIGQLHAVQPDALANIIRVIGDHVQTVLINACYSKIQAEALAEVVDSVIGMSKPISDAAAVVFAAGFYQAISYGRPVRTAFELGKASLQLENNDEGATPVLLGKGVHAEQTRGWHVLQDFPRYPAVPPGTVPMSIVHAFGTVIDATFALNVIGEANSFRKEADPQDVKAGLIKTSHLAATSPTAGFWASAFNYAGLQSPRMLAAALLIVDDAQFPDDAKRDREKLLSRLKTWPN
jgi:hypothetical protein